MKKPLIYYCIVFFIGCFISLIFKYSIIYGAVLTASFLVVLLITMDKYSALFCLLFFLCGMFDYGTYFSININDKIEARVVYKNGYYCIGSYKGRKISLTGDIYKLNVGEKIIAEGKIEQVQDYVHGIVGNYKIIKYQYKKDFISYIYDYKRRAYTSFKEIIGEENSAIIMSLCFGDTSYVTRSQKMDFIKLGVIHAFSVSGLHLSLIYSVIEYLTNFKFAILTSLLYLLFTGAQASTARAFIMIVILKLSKIVYKNYDSTSALCLAGLVLLIAKPYYITDIGFMLSFLATLGILLYYKKIKTIFNIIPNKLREPISLSLSAQIFTLPYTACTLNNFSPSFILGNIILLPIYSVIIVIGNIAILFVNIPSIFKIFCYLINSVMTLEKGATFVLLSTNPSIITLNVKTSAAVLCIYFSYLLYKHGNNKALYVPIIIFVIFIFNNYTIMPCINCFNYDNTNGIYVKYKGKTSLICNYDIEKPNELIDIVGKYPIGCIITNADKGAIIKINKKLSISIRENGYDVKFNNRNFFIGSSKKKNNIDYYILTYYDIIKFNYVNILPNKGEISID